MAPTHSPEELLRQAFTEATTALQLDNTEAAEAACQRALQIAPGHPVALHLSGLCAARDGKPDVAITRIAQALHAAPDYVDAANNLGNIHLQRGSHALAERCFRHAIKVAPGYAPAHNNLGILLRITGRHADAIASFRAAIHHDPGDAQYHENLGNACRTEGDAEEAITAYEGCLRLLNDQGDRNLFNHLARLYHFKGNVELAVATIDRWLQAHPDDSEADHMRAAITGENVPSRASDACVQTVFDTFASNFEATLAGLGYRVPQLIAAELSALARTAVSPPPWDVLDAGCGTGLCGPLLRPLARHLTGVDLSPKMVDLARQKEVYDELLVAELGATLDASPASFDLIVSADTLVYFGDLAQVCRSAEKSLKPHGFFLFSVELAPEAGPPFFLHAGGRYAHTERYTRESLASAGFTSVRCDPIVGRQENGVDVPGLMVTASRG